MKKQFLLFYIAALLLYSCAITPKVSVVYDESIAVEETAWIYPANIGLITGYNGIQVEWKTDYYNSNIVQIPSGDTLLEWTLNTAYGNTIYKGSGVLFRYNFLPGKQYLFAVRRDPQANENETGSLGLMVYMYDIGQRIAASNSDMDKHYYGFAPFLNLENNRRTVLE